MTGTTSLKLSDLLGTCLPEANALEKRTQKILRDGNNDDDDEKNQDANFIEDTLKRLIYCRFDTLKSIDQVKRFVFWNELHRQLQQLPQHYLTAQVEHSMSLLRRICNFNFIQKPLSFAFEGIHNMNMLNECEGQLLKLINELRNKYGLVNILDTQYQAIHNQRRKIVIVVAGGLKTCKSSFINYLLESDVCPVGICETTARLTKITYGERRLVKLESVDGKLKEQYEFASHEQLKGITKKLIALERTAREEDLCKDVVTIHLDRKELENIELWDSPGFDENPVLNSIIEDILEETNIFFILSSVSEAIRETTVSLLQSCSKKHKRQPYVCFIVTKIDQVTTNPNAEKTLDETLDHLYHQIQHRFKMKLGEKWQFSPFFIPLCTHPKHSLKDFLVSREQFTRKLMQFFTDAVRHYTLCRLEYLIDMMHELLDYDDLNRSIQRDEKLSNMLSGYLKELDDHLKTKLKEPFIQIHKAVAKEIAGFIQSGNDDVIQQALTDEIQKKLLENRKEIEQSLSEALNKLHSKLEKNPALTAVIDSFEKHTLYGDPYRTVIGQYKDSEASLLLTAEFYHARPSLWDTFRSFRFSDLSQLLKIYIFNLTGVNKGLDPASMVNDEVNDIFVEIIIGIMQEHYRMKTFLDLKAERRNLLNQARETAESNAEMILKGLLDDISNHLYQALFDQLNKVSEDIRRRKVKLSEQKNTTEALQIARFLKENTSSIIQLYLNLLDKANRFEYPRCNINLADVLGKSNFPVFAGELGDTNAANLKKIAAKRVPLKRFIWQEVRYMNELKHENILRYYGVRKSEDMENHYYIIMQRLDFDLTKCIDDILSKRKVNDKLMDDIFIQITSGLSYLHEQGLIHRDIKPENVLVRLRKEQSPVFVLADFGFIHRVPISIKGTQGFLAPELVTNTENIFITTKIDMYALGATIQQVLKNSKVDKTGKYIKFWTDISQRCLLDNPFERPTCQQILEEHNNLAK